MRLQGHLVHPGVVYDTIRVTCNTDVADIYKVKRRAKELRINLRYYPDNSVGGGGVVCQLGAWSACGICCCRSALLWTRL